MSPNSRRTTARTGVASGSVWESRIRHDEVKGGIKVFSGGENGEDENDSESQTDQRLKSSQSIDVGVVRSRKTWKLDTVSDPAQLRKPRSDFWAKLAEDFDKDSNFAENLRSEASGNGDGGEYVGKNGLEEEDAIESIDIKEVNSAEVKSKSFEEKEKIEEAREIPITPSVAEEKTPPLKQKSSMKREKSRNVHEVLSTSPFKQRSVAEKDKFVLGQENAVSPQKRKDAEEKEKINQIREVPISPLKPKNLVEKERSFHVYEVPDFTQKQRSLAEKQKFYEFHETPIPSSFQKPRLVKIVHPSVDPDIRKPAKRISNSVQQTQNGLRCIVDLVMWRDIPKSALVFGLGTLILFSLSFTEDLNFSFISAVAYLSLFYLGAIFFFKSFLCRRAMGLDYTSPEYIVGEEEAVWLLKLILPFFNEVLIKIRSLFSGDPATTLKLAILLFVLAQCGRLVTLWTLTRLAFFGVLTLPRLCSAYSNQITGYGKFWVHHFADAWASCTQKKIAPVTLFIVLWNYSSIAARIWAVFMVIVAIRHYQQSPSSRTKQEPCSNRAQQHQVL